MSQKSEQLELALDGRGEAPRNQRSGEAPDDVPQDRRLREQLLAGTRQPQPGRAIRHARTAPPERQPNSRPP